MALKIIIHYNVYIYKPLQYTLYFVNTEPLASSENEWSSYVVCYADEAVIHATIACTVIPTLHYGAKTLVFKVLVWQTCDISQKICFSKWNSFY